MEGKTSKYSISACRKNAKEKRNISKREYYKKNQEKLAEKARERMKRLREKRKLQSETDLKGRGSVATRASAKERKSREKRAAHVRARKMERKREEERVELRKQHRRRQTENCVRNYREKRKLADDQARPESEEECVTPTAFSSRMAKKGPKEKVTPTLPQSPRKKSEVVQTLANSPTTRRLLEKRGFLQSSSDKQNIEAMKSVMADLKQGLAQVKSAKSTDQRAAYSVARSLVFGAAVKKNRLQSRVANLVGVKRQQVARGIARREKVLKGIRHVGSRQRGK